MVISTRDRAVRLVRHHGVVLESARGEEPSLAERIAGGGIRGSWWAHPAGHQIFEITQAVRESRVVLVCSLAGGRITYIHRRLWPGFIRMAGRFPPRALDQIREVHSPSGRHRRQDIPFPAWAPSNILESAASISDAEAAREICPWLQRYGVPRRR